MKCPECGYEPEAEEIAGDTRRRVFWELTRFSQYSWLVVLGALALLAGVNLSDRRPQVAWLLIVAPVFLVVGFGAQAGVASRCPLAYRPLIRRLWRISLLWLQLPWIASWASYYAASIGYRIWLDLFPPPGGPRWWGGPLLSPQEQFVVLVIGGSLGTVLAPFLWRWRWAKLISVSGLPTRTAAQVGFGIPMRVTLLPGLVCFVAPAVIAATLQALDVFFPRWWR